MPKTTIKEILIDVVHGAVGGDSLPLTSNENKAVDTALTEIRQLLKEAEPEKLYGVKITEFRAGHNQAIDAYIANIEKRLG